MRVTGRQQRGHCIKMKILPLPSSAPVHTRAHTCTHRCAHACTCTPQMHTPHTCAHNTCTRMSVCTQHRHTHECVHTTPAHIPTTHMHATHTCTRIHTGAHTTHSIKIIRTWGLGTCMEQPSLRGERAASRQPVFRLEAVTQTHASPAPRRAGNHRILTVAGGLVTRGFSL